MEIFFLLIMLAFLFPSIFLAISCNIFETYEEGEERRRLSFNKRWAEKNKDLIEKLRYK